MGKKCLYLPDKEIITTEQMRRHLISFLEVDGEGFWKRAKHLEYLCKKVEEVEAGRLKRLMVFMPPRRGKSEVCAKKFPAWFLVRNPNKEVILTSYGADLAEDFSKIARDTFGKHSSKFKLALDPACCGGGHWGIQGKRGGMFAVGIGGSITGRGAAVAIIDDPVKNWEEAQSKTIRDTTWDWYRSTFRTRLDPNGAIILIMTRWHEDDLAGRLLGAEEEGEPWEVISFPEIAIENDILGRKTGEILWPDRFPFSEHEKVRKDMGGFMFNSLYQQEPLPEGGQLFKKIWFRYFKEEQEYYLLYNEKLSVQRVRKSDCIIIQTCDTAATETEKSDYFVLTTFAITPSKEILILDVFREKAETTKHKEIIIKNYTKYSPAYILVENRTYGLALIQEMKATGIPVRPAWKKGDKISRARTAAARYELGGVYHKKGGDYLMEIEKEILKFPSGKHDDQVDTISMCCAEVAMGKLYFPEFTNKNVIEFSPSDKNKNILRGWCLNYESSSVVFARIDNEDNLVLIDSSNEENMIEDMFLQKTLKLFKTDKYDVESYKFHDFTLYKEAKEKGAVYDNNKIMVNSCNIHNDEGIRLLRGLLLQGKIKVNDSATDIIHSFNYALQYDEKQRDILKIEPFYSIMLGILSLVEGIFDVSGKINIRFTTHKKENVRRKKNVRR